MQTGGFIKKRIAEFSAILFSWGGMRLPKKSGPLSEAVPTINNYDKNFRLCVGGRQRRSLRVGAGGQLLVEHEYTHLIS